MKHGAAFELQGCLSAFIKTVIDSWRTIMQFSKRFIIKDETLCSYAFTEILTDSFKPSFEFSKSVKYSVNIRKSLLCPFFPDTQPASDKSINCQIFHDPEKCSFSTTVAHIGFLSNFLLEYEEKNCDIKIWNIELNLKHHKKNNCNLAESNFNVNCIKGSSVHSNPTFYYHKCLKCASNTEFYDVKF